MSNSKIPVVQKLVDSFQNSCDLAESSKTSLTSSAVHFSSMHSLWRLPAEISSNMSRLALLEMRWVLLFWGKGRVGRKFLENTIFRMRPQKNFQQFLNPYPLKID